MLTEEKINANFLKFRNYLEKYDCFSEEMFNEIGEKIKYAPFSREKEYGGAEPGSLIDVTLNKPTWSIPISAVTSWKNFPKLWINTESTH